MTLSEIKEILLWCTCINYAILFVWFGIFIVAHDWLYRLHACFFMLSDETFDAVHYGGMAVYKIGILLLNLVPLIAVSMALGSAA